MSRWPEVQLDAVARLRILAAGLPHAAYSERVIASSFEDLWAVMGDLERGVPRFEGRVADVKVLSRSPRDDGEELELLSRSPTRLRLRFRAFLAPGWCVMTSRFANVGMAATPDENGTRVGHFEHARWLGAIVRPFSARNVEADFDRLTRILDAARMR